MLNVDKCKTLKLLGFPQPEFAIGQFWYSAYLGYLSVACFRQFTNTGQPALAPLALSDYSHNFDAGPILGEGENVYVPSACEILQELEGNYVIGYQKGYGFYCIIPTEFNKKVRYFDSAEDAVYNEFIEIKRLKGVSANYTGDLNIQKW